MKISENKSSNYHRGSGSDFGLKFLQWKHRDFLMMTSISHQNFTGMTVSPVMLRQAGISLDSACFNDSKKTYGFGIILCTNWSFRRANITWVALCFPHERTRITRKKSWYTTRPRTKALFRDIFRYISIARFQCVSLDWSFVVMPCCFLPFHILGFDVFGGSKMNCYCRMIGLVTDSNGFSVQFYVLWIATASPRITSDWKFRVVFVNMATAMITCGETIINTLGWFYWRITAAI